MANLIDKDNNILIKFILTKDVGNTNWITYTISILSKKDEKLLLDLSQDGLYLEACYEHELQTFCNELTNVITGKQNAYSFEPIDQGEFKFEIKTIDKELFMIELYSQYFKFFGTYKLEGSSYLGIKTYATKENILNFISELKNEYEKIISPKLLSNDKI